jgi:hypothetical protein
MPDALDWEERGVRIEEEEEADRDVDWGRKRPDSSGRALMVCRFTEFSGETKRQSGERKSESITATRRQASFTHSLYSVSKTCLLLIGEIRHMNSDPIFGTKRNAELAC